MKKFFGKVIPQITKFLLFKSNNNLIRFATVLFWMQLSIWILKLVIYLFF